MISLLVLTRIKKAEKLKQKGKKYMKKGVSFLMLVASFCGLYCSITHLHVYQCQPASLMNTQQLFACE